VEENIYSTVCISCHEIESGGVESDEATVTVDLRELALVIRLRTVARNAYTFGRQGLAIMCKDVAEGVGRVSRHQVAGTGHERDPAPIGAYHGSRAEVISLGAIACHAHSFGDAELTIASKNVPLSIRVAWYKV